MAVTKPLAGKTVTLRCADSNDARFILDLRNDPELSRYLPRLDVSIDQQVSWIEAQREREGDYYFVILNAAGRRIGTLSIYDIEDDHGENGRLVCTGSALQVMEAFYLINEFTFNDLGLEYFTSNVGVGNDTPKRMVEYFGGRFGDEIHDLKGMPTLSARTYKEDYLNCKGKIERLLRI